MLNLSIYNLHSKQLILRRDLIKSGGNTIKNRRITLYLQKITNNKKEQGPRSYRVGNSKHPNQPMRWPY